MDFRDCSGLKNPWTILSLSREQAARVFQSDVNSMLAQANDRLRHNYEGWVGASATRDVIALGKQHAGMRIRCARVPHGTFRLQQIGLTLDGSASTQVKVYDRNNTLKGTYSINAVGGSHSIVTIPDGGLELPLTTVFGEPQEYYIVHEKNPSALPRRSKADCGCSGGTVTFDVGAAHPLNQTGASAWSSWLMAGGWQGDSLSEFDVCANEGNGDVSQYTNGVSIAVKLECNASQVTCGSNYDASNEMNVVAAYAIMYKAAEIAAGDILMSPDLTRTKVISAELLRERRVKWAQEYYSRVEWIAANAEVTAGGCLKCRPMMQVRAVYS